MSQYYGESQWPGAGAGAGQPTWDHQTPPPARSGELGRIALAGYEDTSIDSYHAGASSAIPREESAAFSQQLDGRC
jgi:hypothetical protein